MDPINTQMAIPNPVVNPQGLSPMPDPNMSTPSSHLSSPPALSQDGEAEEVLSDAAG